MNRNTLFIFAKRILNSGSAAKATASLRQLKTLLEEQGAPAGDILLLEKMLSSIPEMREVAKKPSLSGADVEIAVRRAKERIARERAADRYSRC